MIDCTFHERYPFMSPEDRAKMKEAAHRWMVRMAGSEEKLVELDRQYRTGNMTPISSFDWMRMG